MKVVLSIAGSDSSAGAGIQADSKTISALGCYATTAITAITAQNTQAILAIEPVSARLVKQQLDAIFSDFTVAAVKIGMLPNCAIVDAVAESLRQYQPPWVVLDPVRVATTGKTLVSAETGRHRQQQLFSLASLITPNIDEAEQLTGLTIKNVSEMQMAAQRLYADFQTPVLLKGGHLQNDGQCHDVLVCDGENKRWLYSKPRIATSNSHGTGCTLSSAIAALLARGYRLDVAVRHAKRYTHEAISAAKGCNLGKGRGGLLHFFEDMG